MVKYILVAGGVISGIGKGVIGPSSATAKTKADQALLSFRYFAA